MKIAIEDEPSRWTPVAIRMQFESKAEAKALHEAIKGQPALRLLSDALYALLYG